MYATLASDEKTMNVDLTPDKQTFKAMMAPDIFFPIQNGWGLRGATTVDLTRIDVAELEATLKMAWEHGRSRTPIHGQAANASSPKR
jgi:hypothetical protein